MINPRIAIGNHRQSLLMVNEVTENFKYREIRLGNG